MPPDGEPQRSARETNKNDSLETNDKAQTTKGKRKKIKGSIKLARNTRAEHGSSTGPDQRGESVKTGFTHPLVLFLPLLLFLDILFHFGTIQNVCIIQASYIETEGEGGKTLISVRITIKSPGNSGAVDPS